MEKPAEAQAKMLEEEEEEEIYNSIQDVNRCEECGENAWKYKCPRCSVRSCSLGCVNSHKERTNCNGKRDRTQFVPLSQFDDNWLISDYNFLEEALRMTESAKRRRGEVDDGRPCWGMHGRNRGGKRFWRMKPEKKALCMQASNRKTNLLFLPKGMSKNRTNKSSYNNRCKCIYWTVEWQFHLTDVTVTDHQVDEHSSLRSILEKHLTIDPGNPIIRHKLRHFCHESIDNLKLLLKKEYTMGNKRLYFELNIKEPLRSQLMHKTIIEYPVVHVVMPSNLMEFQLCKVVTPVCDKVVKPSSIKKPDVLGHPEGIPFREEEIGGEFEPSSDLNSFPENKNEEVIVCREAEIKEGETKMIEDPNLVPQKSVNPSNSGEHDDPVQLEGILRWEEEIEEGELELINDKNLVPEKFSRTSNFDELDDPVQLEKVFLREEEIKDRELELIKDENLVPEICLRKSNFDELDDSVQLKEVPLREENKEGEFELINDKNPAPDKFIRISNFDDLEDFLHLEDLPFKEEIEEGEFVAHQHFSEDFPL